LTLRFLLVTGKFTNNLEATTHQYRRRDKALKNIAPVDRNYTLEINLNDVQEKMAAVIAQKVVNPGPEATTLWKKWMTWMRGCHLTEQMARCRMVLFGIKTTSNCIPHLALIGGGLSSFSTWIRE
jgi:hypothetical protein